MKRSIAALALFACLFGAAAASADYNGAVGEFDGGGGLATLTAQLFSSGWTAIEPEAGNGDELFYNSASGVAVSVKFDAGGNASTAWSGTFSPGWTVVEPTNNGLMLFYNGSTGRSVGVSFDASGAPTSLSGDSLNRGWTTVTALSGGVQMFYNRSSGAAASGTVDSAGHYHQISSQTMSPGWRIITRLPNGLEFFYNPSGLSAVGHWNGSTVATLKSYTISGGWTSILQTGLGQEAFYNAANGLMAIGTFDSSGNLTTDRSYTISPSWDIATALPNGGGLSLFYSHTVRPGQPAPTNGHGSPPTPSPPTSHPPGGANTQPTAAPEQGSVVNAVPETGTIRVAAPGAGFVPVNSLHGQVPVGATLDTRHGTVHLFAATDAGGQLQDGFFRGALFLVHQGKKAPLTTLTLTGGVKRSCGLRKRTLAGATGGQFLARGRDSATMARKPARWRVTDTCAGTLTMVQHGTVEVQDFTKHHTVKVTKGHSYLARRGNR